MTASAIPTITVLHGLVSKLVESIQDRKFAAEMREVQKMVATVNAEHFELNNSKLQLIAENTQLKQRVASLEQSITDAQKQNNEADNVFFHKGVEFRRGIKTGNKWLPFCPVCHLLAHAPQFTIGLQCTNKKCGWESELLAVDLKSEITKLPQ